MQIDVCFPKNNESEFIKKAEKLGITDLFLVYPYNRDLSEYKEKIGRLKEKTKISLVLSLMPENKDVQRAKRVSDMVLIKSSENNRQILEKSCPDIIFDMETLNKKDNVHYRSSNMNQVLCKLISKNGIVVGFSFSTLLNSKPRERAVILGRIMQNILFCRKYDIRFFIGSFAKEPFLLRDSRDLLSLLKVLGASDKQIKDSQASIMTKIKDNVLKKNKDFISEDIELV